MKIGISHTTCTEPDGRVADPGTVARHLEDLGLDSFWVSDHLAWDTPILDSVLTLTAAAAVTRRTEVGFAVLQLALRRLAWIAKQLQTLQIVSGNRLNLGVGVGGHPPQEWAAAGVPLAERGRRTDEALDVLPALLAGETVALPDAAGAPVRLTPAAAMPRVWIGGSSPAALRRTARFAHGWLPAAVTPDQIQAGRSTLAGLAEEYGRAEPRIGVSIFATLDGHLGGMSREALVGLCVEGFGMPREHADAVVLGGRPEEVAKQLDDHAALGVDHAVLVPFGGSWRRQCDLLADARSLMSMPST
jgi:alkanesulfonate monooxygenase SsuD/methylene tetrahydromethanopterin reductase-like flavin-dependent oxidoreductase (luciferase family)